MLQVVCAAVIETLWNVHHIKRIFIGLECASVLEQSLSRQECKLHLLCSNKRQDGQVSLKTHVFLPSYASTFLPTPRCLFLIMNLSKAQDKYRLISLTELAQHNTADSAWLAVKRRNHSEWEVWDFTNFLSIHPGGGSSMSSSFFPSVCSA